MATNVQWGPVEWTVNVLKDGLNYPFGTHPLVRAAAAITYAASTGKRSYLIDQSISAGAAVDIWSWSDSNNFALLALEVLQLADVLQVEVYGDRPTSSTDTTPSGLAVTANALPFISFGAPLLHTTNRILTNATRSTHAGTGTALAGSGPIAASGEEEGRYYRLRVKNPLTTVVRVAGGIIAN